MLGDRAEPEDDAGSSDDNGVVEDSNAADLRSVLEQIRLNASDKPSTWHRHSRINVQRGHSQCQRARRSG